MESEKRFSLQKSEICSKVFTDKSNEWDKGRILTSYLARRAKHLSLLRSPALLALAYWSLQCSAMWARPIVIIACSSMMMLLLPPPPPPSSSVGTLNQKWEISFQNEPWLNLEDSTSYSLNCCRHHRCPFLHWTRIEKSHSKMNLDWILKTLYTSYSLNCLFYWCLNNFQVTFFCCWLKWSPKLLEICFSQKACIKKRLTHFWSHLSYMYIILYENSPNSQDHTC